MRVIQAVLLTAILVVLSVIGLQLTRIANALAPVGERYTFQNTFAVPAPESRAERNKRLQREMSEAIEDGKALLATPTSSPARPRQNTPAPAR